MLHVHSSGVCSQSKHAIAAHKLPHNYAVPAVLTAAAAAALHAAQETNTIKVWNNGDGIPVEMHKEEGVFVPELIFGHLLTSSNYNDMEKKVRLQRKHNGCHMHMQHK